MKQVRKQASLDRYLVWHDQQGIPLPYTTRFHLPHNNSSHVLEFVNYRHPTIKYRNLINRSEKVY